jgi:hypothetical protein
MIIYGSKARMTAKELQVEKCTSCGTMNSVELNVFQKYAHVFWIPFVPIGKAGVSICHHCKQTLKVKEMPESLRDRYDDLRKRSKTPVWTFLGIGLVATLIIVAIISGKQDDARNAKLILSPQKGDIYKVKIESGSYTLYKITEVIDDTVYIQTSQYETNKITGLSDLKKKGFTESTQPVLKSTLKGLFDKGHIIDIDR